MRSYGKKAMLAGIFFMALNASVSAASVTVTGQGGSERSALHQAMRQAIEQQVGVMVDSRSYVQNYRLIQDRIYSQADGYIQSYEVLASDNKNGIYTVTIRADVQDQKIQAALGTYAQKKAVVGANMQDPRIGIVAADPEGARYADLENLVMKGLSEQGFTRLVDVDQLDAAGSRRLASAMFSGDAALQKSLASRFPVDYLVIVHVNKAVGSMADYVDIPGFEKLKRADVTLSVRMFNVNTGEVLYAGVFTGRSQRRGPHALQEAISQASEEIPDAVGKAALGKAANPEQHLQLIVTSNQLGSIHEATAYLQELAGVSNVYVRDASFGNMTIDLDFLGTAHDFAVLLENQHIKVLEMGSEYVKI